MWRHHCSFFIKRQGEDSLNEEEDYDAEKVEEDKVEERADDDMEIDKLMRDLSLHPYQYEPERNISGDSSESSISGTTKIRER